VRHRRGSGPGIPKFGGSPAIGPGYDPYRFSFLRFIGSKPEAPANSGGTALASVAGMMGVWRWTDGDAAVAPHAGHVRTIEMVLHRA
jgi:hypothetical protein